MNWQLEEFLRPFQKKLVCEHKSITYLQSARGAREGGKKAGGAAQEAVGEAVEEQLKFQGKEEVEEAI